MIWVKPFALHCGIKSRNIRKMCLRGSLKIPIGFVAVCDLDKLPYNHGSNEDRCQ